MQLSPLLLLGAGLVVAAWQVAAPGAASGRALQFVMVLFVASGLIGIGYHYAGNEEFERELYPGVEGWTLVGQTLAGATPVLAPGAMTLILLRCYRDVRARPRLRLVCPAVLRASNSWRTAALPKPLPAGRTAV